MRLKSNLLVFRTNERIPDDNSACFIKYVYDICLVRAFEIQPDELVQQAWVVRDRIDKLGDRFF